MVYGFRFGMFGVLFTLVFIAVLCVFAAAVFRSLKQYKHNNDSPRLTVDATVVAKRTEVSGRHHDGHTHRYTAYYATFQVESGDRMELPIPNDRFGYLIEGDRGRLTFQGTRFLEFQRL